MTPLIDKNTRLVVQGITGSAGAFHAKNCMDFGTNVVAGVTPGKGGQLFEGKVPVFDTVAEAKKATDCNASMIFVPPPFAADAIMEAADAGVKLIVCITEGIPVQDMQKVKTFLKDKDVTLIGPNCPGIVNPSANCKIGIMPAYIFKPGRIGIVSRSGTLTYEAVWQVTNMGLGQSMCIGIGGDPVHGMTQQQAVQFFTEDPNTDAFIMIGEIGGSEEEEAAEWIKNNCKKPVAAFIAGATAPKGRRMGHAGAIVAGGKGTAAAKQEALKNAGIVVAKTPAQMGAALAEAMKNKDVFITEDDLEELPCDTFYIKDLIGMDVTDAESGEKLGRLKDVLQPSSQDVYVVEREEGGDILIPAVSEFIKEVSLENRVISVKLIEGMAE